MHGVKAAIHVEGHDLVEFFRRCLRAGLSDWTRAAGHIDENIDPPEGGGR